MIKYLSSRAISMVFVLGAVIGHQNQISQRVLDCFLETKKEKSLESKINKEIYFNLSRGEERNKKIKLFTEMYDEARKNWDHFDEQFKKVNSVFFDNSYLNSKYTAHVNDFDEIIIDKPPRTQTPHAVFIHEIAHIFLKQTKEDFNEKWMRISENHYIPDYKSASPKDMVKNGAIRKNCLNNLNEDLAYTAGFVYDVCHPNIKVRGLPNKESGFRTKTANWEKKISYPLEKEAIPRLKKKINMLKEYNFISKREYVYVISELKRYKKIP